jgi:hypothetical protein
VAATAGVELAGVAGRGVANAAVAVRVAVEVLVTVVGVSTVVEEFWLARLAHPEAMRRMTVRPSGGSNRGARMLFSLALRP